VLHPDDRTSRWRHRQSTADRDPISWAVVVEEGRADGEGATAFEDVVQQSLRPDPELVSLVQSRDLDEHHIHTVPCARGRDQ
jgi:hypothetical protein